MLLRIVGLVMLRCRVRIICVMLLGRVIVVILQEIRIRSSVSAVGTRTRWLRTSSWPSLIEVLVVGLIRRTPSVLLIPCIRPSRCAVHGREILLCDWRHATISFLLRVSSPRARTPSRAAACERIVLVPGWEAVGIGDVGWSSLDR